METTVVSRRMAMVETSNDRYGIVVQRSIGQRSRANQDPRSDTATTSLVVLASSQYLETTQLEDSRCIVEAVPVEMQYWNTTRELTTLSTT